MYIRGYPDSLTPIFRFFRSKPDNPYTANTQLPILVVLIPPPPVQNMQHPNNCKAFSH